MADIEPLLGWRYDSASVGNLSDVTAPPYDVINPQEQKALYELHPCNVVRLILNREEVGDKDDNTRYERAANFLRHWKSEGVLQQEREDSVYVYHQDFEWEGVSYSRKGFLAKIRLEEIGTGNVFPHEQTLPGPKKDRLSLLEATKTNLSPIFGLYPDSENEIQETLEVISRSSTPIEIRDENNVNHRMWIIDDRDAISSVRDLMLSRSIFIADGHHRYETACKYREVLTEQLGELPENHPANYVLMMFVGMNDPGLAILPTHRIFSGISDLSVEKLKSILEPHFEIEIHQAAPDEINQIWELVETDSSSSIMAFGIPGSNDWILARFKEDSEIMDELAPDRCLQWQKLGVALLHQLVLSHLLKDHHTEDSLKWRYVHKIEEISEAVSTEESETSLVCLVPAATMEDVQIIAQQRETMPPKSTYFYPKLLSGLVFNDLE